jgi:hypothetical protein
VPVADDLVRRRRRRSASSAQMDSDDSSGSGQLEAACSIEPVGAVNHMFASGERRSLLTSIWAWRSRPIDHGELYWCIPTRSSSADQPPRSCGCNQTDWVGYKRRPRRRSDTMKLYFTAGSPYARITRIVIIEKGLEDRVDIVPAQTRIADSPYYRINPSGRVPYLVRDDGVGIEESASSAATSITSTASRNSTCRRETWSGKRAASALWRTACWTAWSYGVGKSYDPKMSNRP